MEDPFAEIRRLIAGWDKGHSSNGSDEEKLYAPLDLVKLRDEDFAYDWLVEGFWPKGAHLHMFATGKTGKSLLSLWIAGNLAIGRDPFTWERKQRERVSYVDKEMTRREIRDRLADMGFDFAELDGWLMYHWFPQLPAMDTIAGGKETLRMMQYYKSKTLILDTLARVVQGEENSNDTFRNFYNYTGTLLKDADISMLRLDHAGHDPRKARGASAKADDVDLVFQLEKRTDQYGVPGYRLTRTHARISEIHEHIDLQQTDEPLQIKGTNVRTWSQQAIIKAKELDELGAPMGASVRVASMLLKEAGIIPGRTTYLTEAIRLRKERMLNDQFGG